LAIGYGITADTSLETCFILYGATTRNGKSTLVETIMHMLGGSSGYAMQMKPESLAQKQNNDSRQANGDIARLAGARFLNVSEPPKKMIFDAALLKTLLGRDSIVARHLHEREFEFVPVFKLFMNTNYLPLIQDDTLFSSGRINVISFERHFGEQEQDKSLKNKLRSPENLSGILNWCLDGLKKFHTEGLKPTKSIIEATIDYRQESDKVGKFLAECLEPANENMMAGTAYEVYEQWCRACGYGCENQGNFFAELRAKNLISKSGTVNGKTRLRVIKGYKVVKEWLHAIPLI
jgi:putative DNA primase/helicase